MFSRLHNFPIQFFRREETFVARDCEWTKHRPKSYRMEDSPRSSSVRWTGKRQCFHTEYIWNILIWYCHWNSLFVWPWRLTLVSQHCIPSFRQRFPPKKPLENPPKHTKWPKLLRHKQAKCEYSYFTKETVEIWTIGHVGLPYTRHEVALSCSCLRNFFTPKIVWLFGISKGLAKGVRIQ